MCLGDLWVGYFGYLFWVVWVLWVLFLLHLFLFDCDYLMGLWLLFVGLFAVVYLFCGWV